jgi:hypothetical protein
MMAGKKWNSCKGTHKLEIEGTKESGLLLPYHEHLVPKHIKAGHTREDDARAKLLLHNKRVCAVGNNHVDKRDGVIEAVVEELEHLPAPHPFEFVLTLLGNITRHSAFPAEELHEPEHGHCVRDVLHTRVGLEKMMFSSSTT